MRKVALVTGLMFLAASGMASAQGSSDNADAQPAKPTSTIRVLRNPYDIASFYRSNQGASTYFGHIDFSQTKFPIASYYRNEGPSSSYPIASFYRNEGSPTTYGYSRFWTSGYSYGASRSLKGAYEPGLYRRRIGQNGDIFLLAPTFLAPVGPLTEAFSDR